MKKHDRLFNQISDAELKAASKEKAREGSTVPPGGAKLHFFVRTEWEVRVA